jgi:ankyrin repeat protein
METISNELSKIIISNELRITGKVINNFIINGEIDKFMMILNNNNNNYDNTIFHYKDIYDSNTLLHVAVLNNHECCIKFLLEKGIDINSKNQYGNTALNLACNLGYEKCIESLLLNGADIYNKDSMGYHPINMCIMKDNEKSFELLIGLIPDIIEFKINGLICN